MKLEEDITIEEFEVYMKKHLELFVADYQVKRAKNPENYPERLSLESWWEVFDFFEGEGL